LGQLYGRIQVRDQELRGGMHLRIMSECLDEPIDHCCRPLVLISCAMRKKIFLFDIPYLNVLRVTSMTICRQLVSVEMN
jgi:hypothetical protein